MVSLRLSVLPPREGQDVFFWQTAEAPLSRIPLSRVYTSSVEPDLEAWRQVLREVAPKQIWIYGPFSRCYQKMLKGIFSGPVEQILQNGLASLF
jgi:hypothetical protein